MKKIIAGLLLVIGISVSGCSKKEDALEFVSQFDQLSFAQLNEKIDAKDDFVAFFGWVEGCGDTVNFEENYWKPMLKDYPKFADMYVVNLDVELPDGLLNKEMRQPMIDAYGVRYAPTFIQYVDGEVVNMLEWTPETTDSTYGIFKTDLDTFFKEIGYIN